ncbi:MAG: cysteine desulfurase, partial [Clostridia bacterium]|nr:cysteine desulfurase [Clostridia bacterium]
YLDNSATTPMCQPAIDDMYKMMTDCCGNPSSKHQLGINAEEELSKARRRVARAVGCAEEEIYFSPSGTAANNTAIFGAARLAGKRGGRIITTSLEHPSVKEPIKRLEANGFETVRLRADREGKISLQELKNALTPNTVLVSMMCVNNEIGSINPIREAAQLVRASGCKALFHCDAVQAFGKLDIKPSRLGVDLMTVSAHKIHGPKGVGALYIRKGVKLPAYLLGGGQESGMFSGTEAMPNIVGFGAAASALPELKEQYQKTAYLKNRLLDAVSGCDRIYVNSPSDALPYVINLSVLGIPSEVMINYLSYHGICVSGGSACKKGRRSDVLTAIGLQPQRIDSAIRISLSRFTTENELDALSDKIFDAINARIGSL